MARNQRRIIRMNVLPSEPTDGRGRVCIHLFVRDERGPFVEPHVLHPALNEQGHPTKQGCVARPTRGRLACDRKRLAAPTTRGGVTTITPRTDDPRATTCPKCRASAEYARAMELLTAAESAG